MSATVHASSAVKQLLTIFIVVFFFLSGPASLWADCSKQVHSHSAEHDALDALSHPSEADKTDDTDSAPRIHCPPSQFDLNAISATVTTSKPNQYQGKLARLSAADECSLAIHRIESIRSVGYPFLIGISPHLLLSVFRI
jgi:hypothetical protein